VGIPGIYDSQQKALAADFYLRRTFFPWVRPSFALTCMHADSIFRILEIGPTFKIQAQATAALDINVDLKVDLSWCISGAKLFYPPTPFHTPSGKFTPNNSRMCFISLHTT
jgi:hypothetical protein